MRQIIQCLILASLLSLVGCATVFYGKTPVLDAKSTMLVLYDDCIYLGTKNDDYVLLQFERHGARLVVANKDDLSIKDSFVFTDYIGIPRNRKNCAISRDGIFSFYNNTKHGFIIIDINKKTKKYCRQIPGLNMNLHLYYMEWLSKDELIIVYKDTEKKNKICVYNVDTENITTIAGIAGEVSYCNKVNNEIFIEKTGYGNDLLFNKDSNAFTPLRKCNEVYDVSSDGRYLIEFNTDLLLLDHNNRREKIIRINNFRIHNAICVNDNFALEIEEMDKTERRYLIFYDFKNKRITDVFEANIWGNLDYVKDTIIVGRVFEINKINNLAQKCQYDATSDTWTFINK